MLERAREGGKEGRKEVKSQRLKDVGRRSGPNLTVAKFRSHTRSELNFMTVSPRRNPALDEICVRKAGHSCFRLPVDSVDETIQMAAAKNIWILQWSGQMQGKRWVRWVGPEDEIAPQRNGTKMRWRTFHLYFS